MAAGLGFKTFTTGEVLTAADTNGYLMQGVLVFASSAARAAAITSPQEGQYSYLKDTNSTEYYDGAAWIAAPIGDITGVTAGTGISGGGTSGTVTITNSMATEIAAKGDLIVGTGAATFDNLTVGTNGQTLVADSSTATGLKWATASSGSTYVGCQATTDARQSISNVTWTLINFPLETWDTNTFHDNTTNNGRMTVPSGKAGKYLISTALKDEGGSATGYRLLKIYKNGSAIAATTAGIVGQSNFEQNIPLTVVVDAAVADYFEIYTYTSGGTGQAAPFGYYQFSYLGA